MKKVVKRVLITAGLGTVTTIGFVAYARVDWTIKERVTNWLEMLR